MTLSSALLESVNDKHARNIYLKMIIVVEITADAFRDWALYPHDPTIFLWTYLTYLP